MNARGGRRCAVVFNPIKISDCFHQLVTDALDRDGWVDTLWLETTAEDPGRAMTAEAVAAGVDLVIGAGGDGTIRIVADGLAGTGIPMGLIPAGTANLLARNLDVPLQEAAAVEVAVTGKPRTIDLIKITVDDREVEHFAVIAGIGVDAMIMDEVDDDLKAKVGSAAYFLAAAKALGRLPVDMTVQVDDHRPKRRRAMLCAIGNVSDLQGNITLIPGARPDDGMLDVYIASPHRLRHWLHLGVRLATRRPKKDDQVDQWTGTTVRSRSTDQTTISSTVTSSGDAPGWSQKSCRPRSPSTCLLQTLPRWSRRRHRRRPERTKRRPEQVWHQPPPGSPRGGSDGPCGTETTGSHPPPPWSRRGRSGRCRPAAATIFLRWFCCPAWEHPDTWHR